MFLYTKNVSWFEYLFYIDSVCFYIFNIESCKCNSSILAVTSVARSAPKKDCEDKAEGICSHPSWIVVTFEVLQRVVVELTSCDRSV